MKYLNTITKDSLIQKYIIGNKTAQIIADELKVNKKTILRYLHFFKIKIRKCGNHNIGNKTSNFKHGKYCTDNFCKCGSKISALSIRCNPCKGIIHSEKIKGENNPNWNEGSSFEPYSLDWTEQLREQIRFRDNYECQNCNMTEEEHLIVNGTILNVHHIDYDKTNCKENNLITVCLSCNTRANFNRNYWQNFYQNKIINKKN